MKVGAMVGGSAVAFGNGVKPREQPVRAIITEATNMIFQTKAI
jgi:hypothetical protein